MDPVTAITSVLMAIASQGSVTITIPNDTEIARELGPIDFTHQLGSIKFNIQTAPTKNSSQVAPDETTNQAPPAVVTSPPAPARNTNEAAPVDAKSQTAPAKNSSQVAPAETTNQAPPAVVTSPAAPARNTNEAAPVDAKSQTAPAKVASQTPPAEILSEEAPAQETGYAGLWYDDTGRSAIKISNCGEGLCGRIAWLKNSNHKSACGTNIIGGVEKVGSVYDNGWIYDPERGRKFDVELKLLSESELRVKGYAGTKWLSKTMVWNRAPSNLKLCS